jgi:histone H3/H4
LIEEGLVRIETYAIHLTLENLRCGLITAIPLKMLKDRRYRISDLTFLSRMIPFSYDYSQESVRKILESIVKKDYYQEVNISLKFPKKPKKITISEKLNEQLIPISEKVTEELELHGFRLLKQLSVLAMSNALRCGRKEVTQRDIGLVTHLSKWINFQQKEISKEWTI